MIWPSMAVDWVKRQWSCFLRVDPDRMREFVDDTLHPDRAGLLVPVLDRAAGIGDLVGAHGGVADEDHPVVRAVGVQHVPSGDALGVAAAIVLPDRLVEAVVEVVVFHVLELGAGSREQLLDDADMVVHRAADIEEHQKLDGVAAFRAHLHVEIAVFGGRFDRAVEIELVMGALAGPAAQALQRHLDVAGAKLDRVVEVAELALVPNLDGAAVAAAVLANAHALGIVAIGAEGRGAGGADPLGAALVPALLLLKPLLQCFHQLVETAKRLDQLFFLVGEVFFGKTAQPFLRQVGGIDAVRTRDRLQPLEDMREHLVEAVDMALVLDQR